MADDFIEEIRCALAMRDAGYDALLGYEATAELLRRYDLMKRALKEIACFDDKLASRKLEITGRYGSFDEPSSVKTAREVLAITSG